MARASFTGQRSYAGTTRWRSPPDGKRVLRATKGRVEKGAGDPAADNPGGARGSGVWRVTMTDRGGWVEGLPVAITVTDAEGKLLSMNRRSRETFAKEGGGALIGSSVFDCHPEPARTKTLELFQKQTPNHYTIRKNGQRKIIHQIPWIEDGRFAGFVEISIPIPDELPHFDRE